MKKITLHNSIVFFTLLITLILGLKNNQDYGIAWDEPMHHEIGHAAYKYMFDRDFRKQNEYEKIIPYEPKYGVGLEVFLVVLEKTFKLHDSRDIYLMRHLVSHLLFVLSAFFFFLLIRLLFDKKIISIIGMLIYLLSPAIYAHSFFNPKDIPFMSVIVIYMYFLIKYFISSKPRNLVWAAFFMAIMLNIRLMGILLLLLTYFLFIIQFIQNKDKRLGFVFILFNILMFIILYATWPLLWEQPLFKFFEALKEISQKQLEVPLLFEGNEISSGNLPWYYIPKMILITTPIVYISFALLGLFAILIYTFKISKLKSIQFQIHFFYSIFFFIPIILVIIFKSNVYDSWRHLYFIYPSLLILTLTGIDFIIQKISKPKRSNIFISFLLIYLISIFGWMVKNHPYQQAYFNEIVSKKNEFIRHHYEQDYWGASFKQTLEYILKTDKADTIIIVSNRDPLIHNHMILKGKERKRIYYTIDFTQADYFITNYRFHHEDYPQFGDPIYSIYVNKSKINSVWKFRNK